MDFEDKYTTTNRQNIRLWQSLRRGSKLWLGDAVVGAAFCCSVISLCAGPKKAGAETSATGGN
eukprot:3600286-Amphidinium_carterae.1